MERVLAARESLLEDGAENYQSETPSMPLYMGDENCSDTSSEGETIVTTD